MHQKLFKRIYLLFIWKPEWQRELDLLCTGSLPQVPSRAKAGTSPGFDVGGRNTKYLHCHLLSPRCISGKLVWKQRQDLNPDSSILGVGVPSSSLACCATALASSMNIRTSFLHYWFIMSALSSGAPQSSFSFDIIFMPECSTRSLGPKYRTDWSFLKSNRREWEINILVLVHGFVFQYVLERKYLTPSLGSQFVFLPWKCLTLWMG